MYNNNVQVNRWVVISLFNLLVVATIGVLLRTKIAFEFPFFDQKHLLHGHYNFAFSGWVTPSLLVLIIAVLSKITSQNLFTVFKNHLWLNFIGAYGMLFSFVAFGYHWSSIIFMVLTFLVQYHLSVKVFLLLKDKNSHHICLLWFKCALVFLVLSSIGAYILAYMMQHKIVHQNWYLLATYFFLHFQYNGWFIFSCFGLLFYFLQQNKIYHKAYKTIFYFFAASIIPAYFLSALWLKLPWWLYGLVIMAALLQLIAWVWLLLIVYKSKKFFFNRMHAAARVLLILSSIAFTIKLFLQAGSTIKPLSTIAFGFRPIVIGYLHLVLLGVVSLFILGYFILIKAVVPSKNFIRGVYVFSAGIVLNELLLMIQGVTAMGYILVPYINEALWVAAIFMWAGICMILLGTKAKAVEIENGE